MNVIVDLNKYFKNYKEAVDKEMLVPDKNHPPSMKYEEGHFLNGLDGYNYYLKISKENKIINEMYNELIAEELASLVNIRCINSNIAVINYTASTKRSNNKYCLMSVNYNKELYDIYSNKDIVMEYLKYLESKNTLKDIFGKDNLDDIIELDKNVFNNLVVIWNAYLYHYRNFPNYRDIVENKVIEQVRRYIFRFLIMDKDYHLGNSEELDNIDEYISQTSPMYDLDQAFSPYFVSKNNSLKSDIDSPNDPYIDFSNFLDISSYEYIELAKNMHKILNIDTIKKVFYIVEKNKGVEIPVEVRNNIIDIYTKHYKLVENIIDKHLIDHKEIEDANEIMKKIIEETEEINKRK